MPRSWISVRRWISTGTLTFIAAALAVLAAAAFALASAASLGVATVTLNGPSGHRTEPIAVTGGGLTVYWLSGESTRHLLCTSATCLGVWPPVKASGRPSRGRGLSGRLGTVRRHGFTQLTLNGHPVYTFAPDGRRRGVATGDGIASFGGTWHVFTQGRRHGVRAPAGGSAAPGGW